MLKQTEIEETISSTHTSEITPVATRTDQGNAVQPFAHATVSPASQDLMRRLVSHKLPVREQARRELEQMDVSTLLALMAQQRRLRNRRLIQVAIAGLINVGLLPLLALWMHSPSVFLFWSMFTTMLAGVAVAFTQTQKALAMVLAQKQDLNAIGALISALEMRDEELQRTVRPVLIRLLPRLRAQDASLLTKEERRILRQFLEGTLFGREFGRPRGSEEETALILAALKALEQVGDSSFLPVVTQWKNGQKRGSEEQIRKAAEDCLPYLEIASANRQAEMEMLRASAPDPALEAGVLLRPASDSGGVSDENLLRPSSSDDSGTA